MTRSPAIELEWECPASERGITVRTTSGLGLGRGVLPGGSDKRQGLALRSGVSGRRSNLIAAGFRDVGVFFEEATVAQAQAGKLTLSQSYFGNNGPSGDANNICDVTTVGATSFDGDVLLAVLDRVLAAGQC